MDGPSFVFIAKMIELYVPDPGPVPSVRNVARWDLGNFGQMGKWLEMCYCYISPFVMWWVSRKTLTIPKWYQLLVLHWAVSICELWAEVIYTFGALRAQFSLAQTSKNRHKNSCFVQLWGGKGLGDVTASVSDAFNMCAGVTWTYKCFWLLWCCGTVWVWDHCRTCKHMYPRTNDFI